MRFAKHISRSAAGVALAMATTLAQPFTTFQVLRQFGAAPDGNQPIQPLVVRQGTLYGTTCKGGTFNQGTAFKIGPIGLGYFKLHDFDPFADGICPSELKYNFNSGRFYGTTVDGGFGGQAGAIFAMSPTSPWTVTALHGFTNQGQIPRSGVIFQAGTMYGTTEVGPFTPGATGAVYSYDFSTQVPLHTFTGTTDGTAPKSALVYASGWLWGTTTSGGLHNLGTVFRMNLSGTITWQHDFTGGSDGGNPSSRLLVVGPFLYGVARTGGTSSTPSGTIYKVALNSPTAPLNVYSFGGSSSSDGASPSGNLAELNGVLYGTTEGGGISPGFGTVYGVNPTTGIRTDYFPLNGTSDGMQPMSGLVSFGPWLYGTASAGGNGTPGNGTVFRVLP